MPKTCISMPLQSLGMGTFSKTCTLICSQMLFSPHCWWARRNCQRDLKQHTYSKFLLFIIKYKQMEPAQGSGRMQVVFNYELNAAGSTRRELTGKHIVKKATTEVSEVPRWAIFWVLETSSFSTVQQSLYPVRMSSSFPILCMEHITPTAQQAPACYPPQQTILPLLIKNV